MSIKVICAWCGRVLGAKQDLKPSSRGIDDPISHGICPQCLEKALCDIRPADVSAINIKSSKR
jgi:hypothetical protein